MNAALQGIAYFANGGYSSFQWVLGEARQGVPSLMDEEGHADLGAIQDTIDAESRFTLQHPARAEAKKAFARMDTSKRVQRALCRNAKPIPYEYAVGAIVTFRRDQGGRTVWSPASRVIGAKVPKVRTFGFCVQTSRFQFLRKT